MNERTRVCTACGIEKSLEAFSRASAKWVTYKNVCKPCLAARARERRRHDPETRERHRQAVARSRMKHIHRRREDNRKQYERHKDYRKDWRFRRDYGITLADYQQRYAELSGKCELCDKYEEILHVDHCHETGRVRGLLCNPCNRLLGRVERLDLDRVQRYLTDAVIVSNHFKKAS